MRTRSMLIAATVASLVASAPPALSGPKSPPAERVVEERYDLPTVAVEGVGGLCYACFIFTAGPRETTLQIEVVDDRSPTTHVGYALDLNGDAFYDKYGYVCGATEEPLAVKPFTRIIVSVDANPQPDEIDEVCPGVATSGTVRLTFGRSPSS